MRRRKSFLWSVVFLKPGDLFLDYNKLGSSGVGRVQARRIIWIGSIGSLALAGITGYLILWHTTLAKGIFGPWPYIVVTMLVCYLSRYILVKWLLERYQAQKDRSHAT